MSTQSSFSVSLKWRSRILARLSLLVMGADALAPAIVEWIWGQDDVVRRNLGNPRGDLAIIQFCWHVWLTTTTPSICGSPPPFGGVNIIMTEALQHVLSGIHDFLLLVQETTSTIYVGEPLPPGKDIIQKLQHNLQQHQLSPISYTFYNFEDQSSTRTAASSSTATTPPTPLGRKTTFSRYILSASGNFLFLTPWLCKAMKTQQKIDKEKGLCKPNESGDKLHPPPPPRPPKPFMVAN